MNNSIVNKFGINSFSLKIIAIVAMACNHIAHAFDGVLPIVIQAPLHVVGGLTFPIMAFLMIEGYHKTSNIKKYMLRLLIFGVLAIVPFFMVFKVGLLNIMFTFLFGLICLYLHDKIQRKPLFWLAFAGITIATVFCDWPIVGVPMIVMFALIKNQKLKVILTCIVVSLAMTAIVLLSSASTGAQLYMEIGFNIVVLGAIPLLFAYNGERGYSHRSMKYLFYIFYPVHLLVIGGIALLIQM